MNTIPTIRFNVRVGLYFKHALTRSVLNAPPSWGFQYHGDRCTAEIYLRTIISIHCKLFSISMEDVTISSPYWKGSVYEKENVCNVD